MADIPAWCRTTGHELLRITRENKLISFAVRRAK
jgi:TusA-related sulfurtransferase